ncbi:MAG: hypothetical protein Q9168_005905 [Polycauliona sp. 1 TL-2023]
MACPLESLAICDECVDISNQVLIDESCFYATNTSCGAYLSNGLIIAFGLSDENVGKAMMNTTSSETSLELKNVGLSLLNFTKIIVDYSSLDTSLESKTPVQSMCYNGTYSGPGFNTSVEPQCLEAIRTMISATECTLRWCINRYSARQESGVFNETCIDSWQSQRGPQIVSISDRPGDYIQISPVSKNETAVVNDQDIAQATADQPYLHDSFSVPTSYESCFVERTVHEQLSHLLSRLFTTNLTLVAGKATAAEEDYDNFSRGAVLYGLNRLSNDDKDAAYNISPDVAFYAAGMVFENHTVVRVRRGWLALPIGLVITTTLSTIATKLKFYNHEIPTWGSSSAALMLRGPWSDVHDTEAPINSAKRMQRRAKRTKVALERTANGNWRLAGDNLTIVDGDDHEQESSRSLSAFFKAFLFAASRGTLGRPGSSLAKKRKRARTGTLPVSQFSRRARTTTSMAKPLPGRPLSDNEGQASTVF